MIYYYSLLALPPCYLSACPGLYSKLQLIRPIDSYNSMEQWTNSVMP
jgi:hypothetical protein